MNDAFKPVGTFEYSQKEAAEARAAELTAKGKGTHFVQKTKEPMPDNAPGLGAAIPRPVVAPPQVAVKEAAAAVEDDEEIEDDEEAEAEPTTRTTRKSEPSLAGHPGRAAQACPVLFLMKARPSRQRPIASGKRSRQTLVAAARAGRARPNASMVSVAVVAARLQARPERRPSPPGRCRGCPGRSPRRGRGSSRPRTRRWPWPGPSPRCGRGSCRTSS